MKIYYMKQSALDYMVVNMRDLYLNYYREKTNQWIYNLFDYDPFEVFMEVPDFELAPIMKRRGQTELENCKILYSKLNCISESQATDERLWAGLCNATFYEYVRKRWDYDHLELRDAKKDSEPILSRFFFKGGINAGKYRNTLSKCWWVGHDVYINNGKDKFWLLDALGADDFSSKVIDIFFSYNFTANITIVSGIITSWKYMIDKYGNLPTRKYLRPMIQYVNALGGGLLLDVFDEKEIHKLAVDFMTAIKEGKETALIAEEGEEPNDDEKFDGNEGITES